MPTVTVKHAQTHLSQLIKQLGDGEAVTITNHGRPVAQLVLAKERPKKKIDLFGCVHAPGLGDRMDDENDPINKEAVRLMLGLDDDDDTA